MVRWHCLYCCICGYSSFPNSPQGSTSCWNSFCHYTKNHLCVDRKDRRVTGIPQWSEQGFLRGRAIMVLHGYKTTRFPQFLWRYIVWDLALLLPSCTLLPFCSHVAIVAILFPCNHNSILKIHTLCLGTIRNMPQEDASICTLMMRFIICHCKRVEKGSNTFNLELDTRDSAMSKMYPNGLWFERLGFTHTTKCNNTFLWSYSSFANGQVNFINNCKLHVYIHTHTWKEQQS